MSRADRRREARKHRPLGWTSHPSPKDLKTGSGWFGEFDRVFRKDNDFVVLAREVQTDWGSVTHLCMRNTDSTDIPWAQKQQIKNELFGEEAAAIEVFPKESELVDDANMYHLWILPKNLDLPFGLTRLG